MIYNSEKIRAWLEGERAYMDEKVENTCPYSLDSIEGKMWLQGFQNIKRLDDGYKMPYQYSEMEKS